MSTYVCEQPGGDVVVFHGMYGIGCPLCKAENDLEALKHEAERLEGERDSLQADQENDTIERDLQS